MKREKLIVLVLGILAIYLAGCGGDDGGGGAVASKAFTYTISDSGGNLIVTSPNRRVVVVHLGFSGTCTNITGVTTAILHSGDAPVTTPGSVVLSFTISLPGAYLESIYIDVDGTNNLTSGDKVWGQDPNDLAGFCVDSVNFAPATLSFDWSTFPPPFIGTTTYTGLSQPFSMEAAPSSIDDDFFYLGAGGQAL